MGRKELYQIAREYDQTVQPLAIAYGNGFDQKGKEYFEYICNNRPHFLKWVKENYPQALQ